MSKTTVTSPSLQKNKVRSHCEDGSHGLSPQGELPLHEIAAQRAKQREEKIESENSICCEWFANGVRAWGKSSAYAEEIGVTESVLSEMLSGKRVVQLRHCLPLLREDPSFDAFVGWQCKVGGRQLPQKITRLTREQVRDRIEVKVKSITQLWKMMRHDIAEDFGAEEHEVDAALAQLAVAEAK